MQACANGAGTMTIDLLQAVQHDWDFMVSDDCLPVQVALQLMDASTLGKADREPDFINMHKQIQRTLKSIVNGTLILPWWELSTRTSP
jgi:exocyst complex component 4